MKKVITLLCILPIIATAQNRELGLNGGISTRQNFSSGSEREFRGPTAYGAFTYMKQKGNWKQGVRLSAYKLMVYENGLPPYYKAEGGSDKGGIFSNAPAISVSYVVDRVLQQSERNQLYMGLEGGICITKLGTLVGLHIGNTYYISPRWGINAEAAANLHINPPPQVSVVIPYSIGVRYKF